MNGQLLNVRRRQRPEGLDASTGTNSAEPLGRVGDRNFEGEHWELRQTVPTILLEADANKQNLSLKAAVMEVECFEEPQRYDPIKRHVVDSRPEPRKPKMTELWRTEQALEEVQDSVLVVERHGRLGVTNEREGCQGAERF